ncbi:DNA translocase FtsK [Singulisphaera sp. PoT]|uniref:DNA translocase FtsK n=1 Tax=Singulisphaera sp. PoT TaxID=3411797 RepID=UPI003BF50DBB
MIDRQRLARNGPPSFLLLASVFLALSLLSYDPADPPGRSVYPPNSPPTNPCGPVGAALAHLLFMTMGRASYVVLLGVCSINLLWFYRRAMPEIATRLVGFLLMLIVTAPLIYKIAPNWAPSHPIGSGGFLGSLGVHFLEGFFGLYGMFLILLATGVVGLTLCYDVLLYWPAQELLRTVQGLIGRRKGASEEEPDLEADPMVPAPRFELIDSSPGRMAPISSRPALNRPALPAEAAASGGGPAPRSLPPQASQHDGSPIPARADSGVRPPMTGTMMPSSGNFQLPPLDLLEPSPTFPVHEHEAQVHARAMLLERTLLDFGYKVRVVQIDTGPVITQFEIELEAGLRVSRITSLTDDLAIALAVPSVRIVAPIPGKTTVGIEVPNERRAMVKLADVVTEVQTKISKHKIPLFLGKDVKGVPLAFDLADMPHLLIAGRTGTGKSVCLNAMILSILMTKRPDEVKLILIDPKMVELSQFKKIPHLMHPVVTDMKKAESLLAWACDKMDERYGFLARAGVRNIQTYNQLGAEEIYNRLKPEDDEDRARIPTYMSYIVIIADEMADLMMTAAKEVESHIVRLAQKARAVGMHLIVATQKPTVDVITGLIKGNLPARIAFQVASRGDSRVVLDEMGADKLLGNGDMLFLFPGTSHIVRAQGTYVSDNEVHLVCQHLEQYPAEYSRELVQLQVGGGSAGKDRGAAMKERDELYEAAIEVVIRENRGSTSMLQRALGIGYGRAARLIDFMAEDGIVGEFKSGSAREVLYSWDEWESLKNGGGSSSDDEEGSARMSA